MKVYVMNKKVLEVLEFPKIQNLLEKFADTTEVKNYITKHFAPLKNVDEIEKALENTNDAIAFIYKKGKPSFSDITDICDIVARLNLKALLNTSECMRIKSVLSKVMELKKSFDEINDSLSSFIEELDPVYALYYEIDKLMDENGVLDDATPILREIKAEIESINSRISNELNKLLNSSHLKNKLQEPIVTMRGDRYCLPIKAEYRSSLQGIIHDISSSGSTVFIEPNIVVSLNNKIAKLQIEKNKEIERILKIISDAAFTFRKNLSINSKNLLLLDFIFAKAAFSKSNHCSKPILNDEQIIDLKELRHLLISKEDVVPIDFKIGDEYKTLIITGPNTGGKTVSLKSVGLALLMAYSGLNIPAAHNSTIHFFDEIFADIGDEQSIEQNLSTFSSHIKNVSNILKEANNNHLLIFDEIGSGTDPAEGSALATSILEYLRNKKITTMASTHYSEIKLYALNTKGVENASCEFDINTLSPTYKLLIGIPGKSNAFAIAKKIGIKEEILDNAQSLLTKQEIRLEDTIISLHEKQAQLEKEEREISSLKLEIKKLKDELKREKEKISTSKDKILKRANEEAAEILKDAKKTADTAIRLMHKEGVTLKELEHTRSSLREKANKKEEKAVKKIESTTRKKVSANKLVKGYRVHILSMGVVGEIVEEPKKNGDLLVSIGSFKTTVNISDVELDTSYVPKKESVRIGLVGSSENALSYSNLRANKTATISKEINLLGLRVDEALVKLDKYIDDVYLTGIKDIRIIHGNGTGALRNAIKNYLNKHKLIKKFHLGDAHSGGFGVTVCYF